MTGQRWGVGVPVTDWEDWTDAEFEEAWRVSRPAHILWVRDRADAIRLLRQPLWKKVVSAAAEKVCGLMDAVPSYEEGRWYRYGGWGCRVGVYRWAVIHLEGT